MTLSLFLPLFIQVCLTLALGFATGASRYLAIESGKVRPRDVALGEKAWPRKSQQLGNAFANQFETPVLFYAAILATLALDVQSVVVAVLAWVWVISRLIHVGVHITSNHMLYRFIAFASGMVLLAALWAVLGFEVMTQ